MITGVHRGLGAALAGAHMEQGDSVAGLSRKPPPSLQEEENFRFHAVDLSDLTSLGRNMERICADVGKVDLVYLNAGVLGELKRIEESSLEEMQQVMNVNVWANKVILDTLFRVGSDPEQVIAISSGAAIYGSSGWGAYSMSKSALNSLIRVVAGEHPGCHFCALAPGLVGTRMLESIFDREPNPDFPADEKLRRSRDEGLVQSPGAAAGRIAGILDRLRTVPSGEYVDLRSLPWESS
jgi:NAD(P)-dependent dehydrogenase (short-subunit alcohol dehydrogenase family)